MMDDLQLCKEISRLKQDLQPLVSVPDQDKSPEDRQKEEDLLQQIHQMVETRGFLVDDVEFERLRERDEDRDMADFLQSRFPRTLGGKGVCHQAVLGPGGPQPESSPFSSKTGLTCSVM